ncbi:hypothetical protein C0992_004282 [Termitomyces sp. T32_za158]|nr:hypothetical protein C0992_004282 [Termitomyces sp. T32_za158]
MASLAALGILTGVGSFIVTVTMAIQAQSKEATVNLSSAKKSMDKAKGSLKEAKELLIANISFLSKEEYNQKSARSQTLSKELSVLRKELQAYNSNLFGSNRSKALEDSAEMMKSACDDFHEDVWVCRTDLLEARERAHNDLEARKVGQEGLTDNIQALYLDAITNLHNIVRNIETNTGLDS